jgi:hemin uptake protein HemP
VNCCVAVGVWQLPSEQNQELQKPDIPQTEGSVPASCTPPLTSAVRVVQFEQIAEGRPEVFIDFQGQRYRLRVTQNGKLILNK